MEAIAANLRDPAWWFTAVFIAILAGIAAAFLKDACVNLATLLSERARTWQANRKKQRQALIESIAADRGLVLVAYARMLSTLGRYIGLTIVTFIPALLYILTEPNHALSDTAQLLLKINIALMGFVTIEHGFRLVSRSTLAREAWEMHRKAHNLPKLP